MSNTERNPRIVNMTKAQRTAPTCGCVTGGKIVRGMCAIHYDRWVHATPREQRGAPPRFTRRFGDYVDKRPDGCWIWTGPTNRDGYGHWSDIGVTGERGLAHRIALTHRSAPSDRSLFACHHCDNPPCVNPEHLYWGTVKDNSSDYVSRQGVHNKGAVSTHCKRGHEIAGDNIRSVFSRGAKRRICRTCSNEYSRVSMQKRRARRAA